MTQTTQPAPGQLWITARVGSSPANGTIAIEGDPMWGGGPLAHQMPVNFSSLKRRWNQSTTQPSMATDKWLLSNWLATVQHDSSAHQPAHPVTLRALEPGNWDPFPRRPEGQYTFCIGNQAGRSKRLQHRVTPQDIPSDGNSIVRQRAIFSSTRYRHGAIDMRS